MHAPLNVKFVLKLIVTVTYCSNKNCSSSCLVKYLP